MKYMGGKSRLVTYIASEINNIALLENIENYYEPFCGGCAIVENINIKNRYASDLNKYLIALLKKLQEPQIFEYPNLSKEQWNHIRYNKDQYEDWLVAWAGFFCSFNCKWFDGWGGQFYDKYNKETNAQLRGYNSCCREQKFLKDINISCKRYNNIEKPYHAIIYCDAPYIGTKQYKGAEEKFDFNEYYNWLRDISKDNLVFVSEYRMPINDFKSIKQITVEGNFGHNYRGEEHIEQSEAIEQLFVVRDGWLVDKYYSDDNEDNYDF